MILSINIWSKLDKLRLWWDAIKYRPLSSNALSTLSAVAKYFALLRTSLFAQDFIMRFWLPCWSTGQPGIGTLRNRTDSISPQDEKCWDSCLRSWCQRHILQRKRYDNTPRSHPPILRHYQLPLRKIDIRSTRDIMTLINLWHSVTLYSVTFYEQNKRTCFKF